MSFAISTSELSMRLFPPLGLFQYFVPISPVYCFRVSQNLAIIDQLVNIGICKAHNVVVQALMVSSAFLFSDIVFAKKMVRQLCWWLFAVSLPCSGIAIPPPAAILS